MMPPRGAIRIVLLAGLGVPVLGCILLVSPDEFGEHCTFAGQGTDCGKCITTRCQTEIDACCREDACAATLGSVEGCADKRDDRCDAVRDARGLGGGAGALASCVSSRCAGFCSKSSGASQTQCSEPSLIRGRGCSCEVSSPGTDFACGTSAFPEAVCCAPKAWPGPALECSCLPIGCVATSDGCLCTRVDYDGLGTTCEGTICCKALDGCSCGTRPCQASQTRVASCSLAEIECPRDQVRQASCSIP